MSSIIEGYNYDIFISYRQKDNKHDGWVTEFVNNLKGELESTFKEEISVYFDINPHDGLLETHDVDESLKEKLKCLVFIPIISRTYCDPKSFAWEHEFQTFVELASKDQFGLKVKLPNGNVASRVLPIRIYDLDSIDIKLCESVLGGVLRGIEFIYAEPGVNRPLKPDDEEKINLTKTKYRNQINKVANAIRDLITALEYHEHQPEIVSKEILKPASIQLNTGKTKIIAGSLVLLALIVLGYTFIPKLFRSSKQLENSIAVLPFINDSQVDSNKYFINGIMEEITLNLQKIKGMRVPGRTSVEQYRNTTKSIPEIARELDVSYIIEGSGEKIGNTIRLRIQLLEGQKDRLIWGEPYELVLESPDVIFKLERQIAEAVATELKTIITPDEKQLLSKKPTGNLTAYDFYRRGREEYLKYFVDNTKKEALENAFSLYNEALKNDSTLAEAIIGLAQVYWGKHYWDSFLSDKFLDSVLILSNIALSYNNELSDVYVLKGDYFRELEKPELAIAEYDKAIKYNPNDYTAYFGKAILYSDFDLVKSIENFLITASLYRGSFFSQLLRVLSNAFLSAGFDGKAKNYLQEALKLDRDSISNYRSLANIEFCLENYESSLEFQRKALELDSNNYPILSGIGEKYMFLGKYEESLKYYKSWLKLSKSPSQTTLFGSHRIGWAYWMNGDKEKADFYFNEQIKYCLKMIETGRVYGNNARIYYDLAGVYAFRGDKKKAYEIIRGYVDQRQDNLMTLWSVSYIKNDPLFDSIRNEPEFQQIVRDIEAKYQAEHERVKKWLEEQGML